MAITYGFYNSLNKDRVYNAEQMSSIFNGIITDGVFSTIGDALMPIVGTGMQVIVKTGKCWFNGTWTLNDALLPLDIEAADVSLTRIDAIIVEIDSSIDTRANTIKMLKGTPSANPAKPALANSEHLHQYALGYVTVSAGATSITADKIEVNVGKSSCPFITSVLQQTNIDDLFNQWNAEFTTWFENVQAQLSDDVAANLQRQIDLKVNIAGPFSPNILSNSTAIKFGISDDIPTPDQVFQKIEAFAMHPEKLNLWHKYKNRQMTSYKTISDSKFSIVYTNVEYKTPVYYSDAYRILSDGCCELVNPSILVVPGNTTATSIFSVLRGKYVCASNENTAYNSWDPTYDDGFDPRMNGGAYMRSRYGVAYIPTNASFSYNKSYIRANSVRVYAINNNTIPDIEEEYILQVDAIEKDDNYIYEYLGKHARHPRIKIIEYTGNGGIFRVIPCDVHVLAAAVSAELDTLEQEFWSSAVSISKNGGRILYKSSGTSIYHYFLQDTETNEIVLGKYDTYSFPNGTSKKYYLMIAY